MRYFFLFHLFLVVAVISIAGYRGMKSSKPPIELLPDMDRQAKGKAQKPSAFFADGRGARPPVPGTVPMGYAIEDRMDEETVPRDEYSTLSPAYYYTGRFGDYWGSGMPDELGLDADNGAGFLRRGKERFSIYCAPCHGESGNGEGVVKKAGFAAIVSLLDPKFQPDQYADGMVYNTIAHGKGLMGTYGDKLTVRDRWAVVAWVRVLQKNAPVPETSPPSETEPPAAGP